MRKVIRNSIIIGLIVIGIGLIVYWRSVAGRPVYEIASVDRGLVIERVSVTGSIAPNARLDLQPEASGRVVSIPVKEGDEVKSGDLLIQIDDRDVAARVSAQQAAVAAAQAQLRELEAGATVEELRVSESAVETAQAQETAAASALVDAGRSLDNARRSLDNAHAKVDVNLDTKISDFVSDYDASATSVGDAVNRLTQPLFTADGFLAFTTSDAQAEATAVASRLEAKAALSRLASVVTKVKASMTRNTVIAEQPAFVADLRIVKRHMDDCANVLNSALNVTVTTLATWQANVSAGQNGASQSVDRMVSARSGLELQERMNATEITTAEIAVANAEAAVNNATNSVETAARSVAQAQAAYNLKLSGPRPENISAQRARVQAEQASLSGLLADLSKRRIVAPVDAVVTNITVDPGENVQPGKAVVSLDAVGRFEIEANVSEVDIALIKVGSHVDITLDAFSGEADWTGTVASVNPSERIVEGVIFYKTKVVFDQEDERLRSGMTANLDIEVDRRDDVVRVPLRAVHQLSGQSYVEVIENGKAVRRDVSLGIESDDYQEVLSGLSVDESVVIGTNGTK